MKKSIRMDSGVLDMISTLREDVINVNKMLDACHKKVHLLVGEYPNAQIVEIPDVMEGEIIDKIKEFYEEKYLHDMEEFGKSYIYKEE